MIVPDINILIYAHREDSPQHAMAKNKLLALSKSLAPFALCSFVVSGFIRIVTNYRIFAEPTPLPVALQFVQAFLNLENCRMIEPADRHWKIFSVLLSELNANANMVSDAYLSAIVIEHGCTLLTMGSDFKKFSELKMEFLS